MINDKYSQIKIQIYTTHRKDTQENYKQLIIPEYWRDFGDSQEVSRSCQGVNTSEVSHGRQYYKVKIVPVTCSC